MTRTATIQKMPLGAKFRTPPKSARERAFERWYNRPKSSSTTTSASDKTLPGQYYDVESGLHQNYFRDYEAQTGRYIQTDPIGLLGGVNTFGYVGGRPVGFFDPKGLDIENPYMSPYTIPSSGIKPDYTPCQYYKNVSDESGCQYHENAYNICLGEHDGVNILIAMSGANTSQVNRLRKCLVKKDEEARDTPDCQTGPGECAGDSCTKKSCINDYHNVCFEKSGISDSFYGGNKPWSLIQDYPNDGN